MEPGVRVGGKYRLIRPLGQGAMGSVWAAVNELTEREFAVKFLTSDSAELRERMLREARASGRINHPNVVEVYDVGVTEGGVPFLVMQLLTGETVEQRLQRVGALPPEEATYIAADVARGLAAAHAAGVVHRDLKPANIFLQTTGGRPQAKIVDFGVSKLVAANEASASLTGLAVGSPAYMSPEQARGLRDVDARSDLWSLGAVLFEMLTGRRAFDGQTAFDVVAEILRGEVPRLAVVRPDLGERLDYVVWACLARDREQRIASAAELVAQLDPEGAAAPVRQKSIPDMATTVLPHSTAVSTVTPSVQSTGIPTESPPSSVRTWLVALLAGAWAVIGLLAVLLAVTRGPKDSGGIGTPLPQASAPAASEASARTPAATSAVTAASSPSGVASSAPASSPPAPAADAPKQTKRAAPATGATPPPALAPPTKVGAKPRAGGLNDL